MHRIALGRHQRRRALLDCGPVNDKVISLIQRAAQAGRGEPGQSQQHQGIAL
jgi:hypothetical protein